MSTVLWGGRWRGGVPDEQYGSAYYWRKRIPTGATRLELSSTSYYRPGDIVERNDRDVLLFVNGVEPPEIGVTEVTGEAWAAGVRPSLLGEWRS